MKLENEQLTSGHHDIEQRNIALNANYSTLSIELKSVQERRHQQHEKALSQIQLQAQEFETRLQHSFENKLSATEANHAKEILKLEGLIKERDNNQSIKNTKNDELQHKADKFNSVYARYKTIFQENSDLKAIQNLNEQKLDLLNGQIQQLTEDKKDAHAKSDALLHFLETFKEDGNKLVT